MEAFFPSRIAVGMGLRLERVRAQAFAAAQERAHAPGHLAARKGGRGFEIAPAGR